MNFGTPKSNREIHQCSEETCAVCLSSLSLDGPIVKTKCQVNPMSYVLVDAYNNTIFICILIMQHIFHMSCLEEVQERKSVCPLCRTKLTPPAKLTREQPTMTTESFDTSVVNRADIVSAAMRGRNAVRS